MKILNHKLEEESRIGNRDAIRRQKAQVTRHRVCVGPGIQPDELPCPVARSHRYDLEPYNGIKNWRCPACMTEHIQKVRKKT